MEKLKTNILLEVIDDMINENPNIFLATLGAKKFS